MLNNDYIEELNLEDDEIYKNIINFENYIITNKGNVFRRINRNSGHKYRDKHWKKVKPIVKEDKYGNKFTDFQLNNKTIKKRNIRLKKLLEDHFDNTEYSLFDPDINSIKNFYKLYDDEIVVKTKYDNLYVSNYGKIFRYKFTKNKWIKRKDYINKYGYIDISVKINGVRIHIKPHRLVGEYFIPNPNNYPTIDHIDNNKLNNYYKNLQWCTSEYNVSKFFFQSYWF